MALEFHVIEDGGLSPETANSEQFSASKLGWVRLSEGLAFIQEEDTKAISLGKDHGVSDWGLEGENRCLNKSGGCEHK